MIFAGWHNFFHEAADDVASQNQFHFLECMLPRIYYFPENVDAVMRESHRLVNKHTEIA